MQNVNCYFNQIEVSNEPFEVDHDAPVILLPKELAEDICHQLLDQGIIDSFIIPELCSKPIKFNA